MTMYLIEDMSRKGLFFAGNGQWTEYSLFAERYGQLEHACREAEKISDGGVSCKVVTDRRKVVMAAFAVTNEEEEVNTDDIE